MTSSEQFIDRPRFATSMLFESFAGQGSQNLRLIAKAARPSLFVLESFQHLGSDGVLLFLRHVFTIPHPSRHRPGAYFQPPAEESRPSRALRPASPTSRPFRRSRDCSPRCGTSLRATDALPGIAS